MSRTRLRDLGIVIGRFPTGPLNAITDVPGVAVGQTTVVRDQPHVVRTGVTAIWPRLGSTHLDYAFAGHWSFNGYGEMTGLLWVEESGLLTSPIVLTNTHQVGLAHQAVLQYGLARCGGAFGLPVVAETYDGWLNDIDSFPLTADDVVHALESATTGPVREGNTGGGTGTICHDFKGGTGTASRVWQAGGASHTVGALVQANHGDRRMLRVDGVPVGREISPEVVPAPEWDNSVGGSIVVVLATDAPLLPIQCRRLARRAAVGLARCGGIGHNGSGDLFLAFAVGNHYDPTSRQSLPLAALPHTELNPLFEAAAEAVEEAILNALTAAETMTGLHGRVVYAIPLEQLQQIVRRHRPEGEPLAPSHHR